MQKTPSSYSTGLYYELQAQRFLQSKGFSMIKHNYKAPTAQIDLIMKSKTQLAFIEVKKTSHEYKQKTLKKFIFKQKNRILGELYKFHAQNKTFQDLNPVLILLIFAKSKHPDLYLYYLTP